MKITNAPLDKILDAYDDPNLQQAAVEFVGLLRAFDKHEDDEYIYKMEETSMYVLYSTFFIWFLSITLGEASTGLPFIHRSDANHPTSFCQGN